ncbi:hypothetical protein PMAYCL1PPCAC_27933, partial [Pristionchus mayeri]
VCRAPMHPIPHRCNCSRRSDRTSPTSQLMRPRFHLLARLLLPKGRSSSYRGSKRTRELMRSHASSILRSTQWWNLFSGRRGRPSNEFSSISALIRIALILIISPR